MTYLYSIVVQTCNRIKRRVTKAQEARGNDHGRTENGREAGLAVLLEGRIGRPDCNRIFGTKESILIFIEGDSKCDDAGKRAARPIEASHVVFVAMPLAGTG